MGIRGKCGIEFKNIVALWLVYPFSKEEEEQQPSFFRNCQAFLQLEGMVRQLPFSPWEECQHCFRALQPYFCLFLNGNIGYSELVPQKTWKRQNGHCSAMQFSSLVTYFGPYIYLFVCLFFNIDTQSLSKLHIFHFPPTAPHTGSCIVISNNPKHWSNCNK